MKKLILYVSDQKSNIVLQLLLVAMGVALFLLERYRHAELIDLNSMVYFVVLALTLIIVWHAIQYMKIRPYYGSLYQALDSEEVLEAVYIIANETTREQELLLQVLFRQQKNYRDQLQKLERMKEIQYHFILQWVHQMKTPLSVIDMQLQQAQSGLKQRSMLSAAEQYELYSSMHEEAEKLQSGLELMLGSARVDHLELDLHIRPIELHLIVRDVINRYKKLLIQYSIFPKLEGAATVITDGKWFTFVMNQLISNAIKYSKLKDGSKGLHITIEQGNELVTVMVRDEGIGIPRADIKRIFEPFFTGHNGRLTGESTGMGLYLAKEICQRLGHTLTVNSEENEGTTFVVEIKEYGIHHIKG